MTDTLTQADFDTLEDCQSAAQWKAATVTIKGRHGDRYPHDWFRKVIDSGMADRILYRWGESATMTWTTASDGEVESYLDSHRPKP